MNFQRINITQLELIYKACLYTLKGEKVQYDSKYDELMNVIISYTETEVEELLTSIDILYDMINGHENYIYYRELEDEEID